MHFGCSTLFVILFVLFYLFYLWGWRSRNPDIKNYLCDIAGWLIQSDLEQVHTRNKILWVQHASELGHCDGDVWLLAHLLIRELWMLCGLCVWPPSYHWVVATYTSWNISLSICMFYICLILLAGMVPSPDLKPFELSNEYLHSLMMCVITQIISYSSNKAMDN